MGLLLVPALILFSIKVTLLRAGAGPGGVHPRSPLQHTTRSSPQLVCKTHLMAHFSCKKSRKPACYISASDCIWELFREGMHQDPASLQMETVRCCSCAQCWWPLGWTSTRAITSSMWWVIWQGSLPPWGSLCPRSLRHLLLPHQTSECLQGSCWHFWASQLCRQRVCHHLRTPTTTWSMGCFWYVISPAFVRLFR